MMHLKPLITEPIASSTDHILIINYTWLRRFILPIDYDKVILHSLFHIHDDIVLVCYDLNILAMIRKVSVIKINLNIFELSEIYSFRSKREWRTTLIVVYSFHEEYQACVPIDRL